MHRIYLHGRVSEGRILLSVQVLVHSDDWDRIHPVFCRHQLRYDFCQIRLVSVLKPHDHILETRDVRLKCGKITTSRLISIVIKM